MNLCLELKRNVLKNQNISREEGLKLYDEPLEDLMESANAIREKLVGDVVDLCSIINGKSGICSENCRYCAQSAYYKTNVDEYMLLGYDEIKKYALENELGGVNRFSIVTSGKGLEREDFFAVVEYYKRLNEECSIKLCASHGIIKKEALLQLKNSGVKRYHHNIETSRNFYDKICTTHTYEDRINTIKYAQEIGLEVCSGGIIGMGELREDRIDMAIELRGLGIKSIPINVLMAIKGTPLENQERLSEEEILKTIAIFRFINPIANIRLAGGRNLLYNCGENAFRAGANATITGNLLTTCGNRIIDDVSLIASLGLKVSENE